MSFLRVKGITLSIFLHIFVSIIAAVIGFSFGFKSGVLSVLICLALTVISLTSLFVRKKTIIKLCNEIDNILIGKHNINLSDYSEGEFSVLTNIVTKITMQMREHSELLKKDKIALSNSIADISHQIKTPLTSINLIITLLSKRELDDEKRKDLNNELSKLLLRIEWLISSLLKISKLDAHIVDFKKEDTNLAELIRKAQQPISIPMELRGQHFIVISPDDIYFKGDFEWTAEAIGNIFKNCMEHTSHGGYITVTARQNTIFTEIVISDNGSGISKKDLPHLFERFYKGENADTQSIGIGLALSKVIITSQNGTIKAENNADGGAKFTIKFYKENYKA